VSFKKSSERDLFMLSITHSGKRFVTGRTGAMKPDERLKQARLDVHRRFKNEKNAALSAGFRLELVKVGGETKIELKG